MEIYSDVVCPFCGTLCDDIEVHVENGKIVETFNACKLGTARFFGINKEHRWTKPMMRKNGVLVEIEMEEAVRKTAEILSNAKKPLLYGWSTTECEAQAAGIELAEEVGGVVDSHSTVCHGPTVIAVQDVGYPSVTLGEVKNRADLIIYWGCNPVHAHPRHMSRYSTYPRGYFRERGELDRTMVVIDARKTDTATLADKFIKVAQGEDYELLSALRAGLNGFEIPEEVAGVKKEDISELIETLKSCQFGILFFGLGLTMSRGKHRNIDNAISLVRDLNRFTKFSIMPMRGHYNVSGFSEVLSWQTGFPYAVDFSRGYPYYNPGETSAVDLLSRGEIDAALIVGADPVANFPKKSAERLAKIPVVVIDPHPSPTTELADIVIPCATAGIEVEGTAYRMDAVPIRVRKVKEAPQGMLSDREILKKIFEEARKINLEHKK